MSGEHNGKKQRLHIVLSLDNPLQREAWEILSHAKNKTSAVCEAIFGYFKLKTLEDTVRSILRDELKHIAIAPDPQTTESPKEPDAIADAAVLDFLWALQNE